MKLETFLKQHYTPSTIKRYLRDINSYLSHNPNAPSATYSGIMNYTGMLREQNIRGSTIQRILQAIKQYYHWLIATGKREDHPCRYIHIKDRQTNPVQLQELFKPEELELLLKCQEHYEKLKLRNLVIISLLIYQGLTVPEIVNIELHDINLDEGTIHIKPTTYTNSRTLQLKTRQIMLLHKYITQFRPKLLAVKNPQLQTERLIITNHGTAERGEGIQYLIETLKPLFPEKNLTPRTIRQSVIANLLKQGKDLRVVQYFAGHKYPSTTEKYRQTGIEALKAAIEKYHPLK